MGKIFIYTLSDPRDGLIKYVGKTINLKQRFNTYIKQAKNNTRNNLVINWVKKLLKLGLKPQMIVLDEYDSSDWEWLEIYWISQFKAWGF
jgi:excinuclease UvrABC nuclease subunit